jgi:hypothetical protein
LRWLLLSTDVIAPSRKRQAVVTRRRQDPALDPWRGIMPRYLSALGAAFACGLAFPALAQQEFPATLAGHAVMPAESFIEAPADAPADLKISGKFTTGRRVEAVGTVMGKSSDRPTGVALPFRGQPVQGHSGVKVMADGTFWILTDNGSGSKANSPDSMLYLNRYRIDWAAGAFNRMETIFLHDPDKKVPFRIVHEGTDKRYLTGSDFDTEGFQWIGDILWIGDEFGPYVIKADKTGKVLAVFETVAEGKPVRSPEHFLVSSPAAPNATANFNLRRSKGFEGFAGAKDGKFLYPLLEGPIWDADKKDWEKVEGKEAARILEFDVAAEKFTGRFWYFVFEQNGNAIGDFNMLDATTGLVIERDNGEGTADKACPAGQRGENCFHDLAKFKRVYKIELSDANVGRPARKIGHIDLMKIRASNEKARKPLNDGVLTFPFFTIENVDVVDDRHIVVGNDNNLPFSSSRDPNKADDNEFVLLEVSEFLKAK